MTKTAYKSKKSPIEIYVQIMYNVYCKLNPVKPKEEFL